MMNCINQSCKICVQQKIITICWLFYIFLRNWSWLRLMYQAIKFCSILWGFVLGCRFIGILKIIWWMFCLNSFYKWFCEIFLESMDFLVHLDSVVCETSWIWNTHSLLKFYFSFEILIVVDQLTVILILFCWECTTTLILLSIYTYKTLALWLRSKLIVISLWFLTEIKIFLSIFATYLFCLWICVLFNLSIYPFLFTRNIILLTGIYFLKVRWNQT